MGLVHDAEGHLANILKDFSARSPLGLWNWEKDLVRIFLLPDTQVERTLTVDRHMNEIRCFEKSSWNPYRDS